MSARKVPDTLGPFYGSFTDGFPIRLPCIELKVKKNILSNEPKNVQNERMHFGCLRIRTKNIEAEITKHGGRNMQIYDFS